MYVGICMHVLRYMYCMHVGLCMYIYVLMYDYIYVLFVCRV